MNINVADDGFRSAGGIVIADVEHAENRLGPVPFLTEGRLGTLHRLPRQLPVAVEPVRIADHDHNPVFAITRR